MEGEPDFFGFFICVIMPVIFMFYVVLAVINVKTRK
jgi:hypothetical protein